MGKEDKENFRVNKGFFLNNFERNDDKFNKVLINEEINFRGEREKQDLWEDRDLLRFRDDPKHNKEFPKPEGQRVEILPGTAERLSGFIVREPQKDSRGRYRYLLTSGLAVEVITGVTRYHHDIDLVLFDYRDAWWTRYLTDNVTPDRYWAEMKFDPTYLEQSAWTAHFQADHNERTVSTVHPAIIMVQKLSNAWGREPRERDYKDVTELVRYWQKVLNSDSSWNPIVQVAVSSLPRTEQARTRDRLAQYFIPKPIPH